MVVVGANPCDARVAAARACNVQTGAAGVAKPKPLPLVIASMSLQLASMWPWSAPV